jgi:hypothetical protein
MVAISPALRHDTGEGVAHLYSTWAKADPSKTVLVANGNSGLTN